MVLFIVMYIFAMLGMTLFGGIEWEDGAAISKHANFDTAWMSMQTVFRLATGDSWSGFYLDADAAAEDGRYIDYVVPVNARYVHAYIVIFMFASLILVSVFIAIVLEYYAIQSALVISEMEVNVFSRIWSRYDPMNTSFIPVWRLGQLLIDLGPPLCPVDRSEYLKSVSKRKEPPTAKEEARQKEKENLELAEFLHRLVIPVRGGGKLHYMEVVVALGEMREGKTLPQDAEKVKNALLANWPRTHPDLLSLPPEEDASVFFNEDILKVVEGEDWEPLQQAYLEKLNASHEEPQPEQEQAAPEGSRGLSISPAALASMPSLHKLSMYITEGDIKEEDVQAEKSVLKEGLESQEPAISAPSRDLPELAQVTEGFAASAQIAPGSASLAARAGPVLKPASKSANAPAAPVMAQPLIDSWIRIRTDLFSEDPEGQLTALVLIRKLLSSPGQAQHMEVFPNLGNFNSSRIISTASLFKV
jgi:hypothetical protein